MSPGLLLDDDDDDVYYYIRWRPKLSPLRALVSSTYSNKRLSLSHLHPSQDHQIQQLDAPRRWTCPGLYPLNAWGLLNKWPSPPGVCFDQ